MCVTLLPKRLPPSFQVAVVVVDPVVAVPGVVARVKKVVAVAGLPTKARQVAAAVVRAVAVIADPVFLLTEFHIRHW